jgi:uncharacterized protein with FMN-binding domain
MNTERVLEMAKKIKKIQIFRHLVQLALFFLLPGLYVTAFSELKGIYQVILKGNFSFIKIFPNITVLLTVVVITALLGRFFCGWFCAFGTYNDFIHEISKKVFKVKYKVNEKADSVLKYLKYVVLVLIVVLSWTMGSSIFSSASPWDAFGQITDFPQVLSSFTIGVVLLAMITTGAVFIERFFCRYLCPLGAIFAATPKISIFNISKPGENCGNCRACTNKCSMGMPLYKTDKVRGGECINCLKCVEVCPRKNAQAVLLEEKIDPAMAGSIAIAAFVGLYSVNNFAGNALASSGISTAAGTNAAAISTNSRAQKYKDGTYTGTGKGYRGGATKISVAIKNGVITGIKTLSTEDTPDFYQRADSMVTNEIVSAQSVSVDTVSGATFSSRGIISAVQDALTQAAAGSLASTNSKNQVVSKTANVTKATVAAKAAAKKSKYKDGTYTGSASGFRGGTTKVSVTVSSGRIARVKTISEHDTLDFYQRALSHVPGEIISAQSTSVDTVSGATFSSRGIINAVANALSNAH